MQGRTRSLALVPSLLLPLSISLLLSLLSVHECVKIQMNICLHIGVAVDVQRAQQAPPLIVCQKTLRVPSAHMDMLEAAGLGQTKMGKQSDAVTGTAKRFISWDALYHRRALIHFPYEVSTMSLFEQYSAGAVLLFPSKRFCQELMCNREVNVIIACACVCVCGLALYMRAHTRPTGTLNPPKTNRQTIGEHTRSLASAPSV